MRRTIETGGQGAPLSDRRIVKQIVAEVETPAGMPYVQKGSSREVVVRQWEQLPRVQTSGVTNRERRAVKLSLQGREPELVGVPTERVSELMKRSAGMETPQAEPITMQPGVAVQLPR